MKKNFLFGLFATAMLLLTTACQKENDLANGNEVMVNFEVSAPVIATRADYAYSDGKTATKLQYAVYNSSKELLEDMQYANPFAEEKGVGTAEMNNLKARVSMRLALGNEYYVLFWAEADDAPYTVDFEGKTLTVNYDGALSNDENRDAFYCWKKVTDEELRNGSVKIEMRRPFAQLNIGTGDTDEAAASGVTATNTAVEVEVYTTLNFGVDNGNGADVDVVDTNSKEVVTFDFAPVPTGQDFPVDGYDYLAMNYLLASADKEVVDQVKFYYKGATQDETRVFTSIPLRRNYRTNIYGNLLTQAVDFNVEIKPEYLGAENVEAWDGKSVVEPKFENGTYTIKTGEELAWLAGYVNGTLTRAGGDNTLEGVTVVLDNNIDLGGNDWTPISYQANTFAGTFDGNGYTISNLKYSSTEDDWYVGLFGGSKNATFKNLTLTNVEINCEKGLHFAALVGDATGNTVIENVTVNGDVVIRGYINNTEVGRIGVIVGGNSGNYTIKNVTIDVNEGSYVEGNSSIGGVAGQLQGTVAFENVKSNIDVRAARFFAGGIIGLAPNKATFNGCSTSGNVTLTAATGANSPYRLGAIAGGWDDNTTNTLTLEGCTYKGTLQSNVIVGFDCAGFVGRGYSAVVGAKVSVNGTVYEYVGNGVYVVAGVTTYMVSTADELQAALTNANSTTQINFVQDIEGNVTVDQKEGVNIVIDGCNKKYDGTITLDGNSRSDADETLVIKNVNFETSTPELIFIDANSADNTVRYAHNVTIDNCTFTATGAAENTVVAMKYRQTFDMAVVKTTATGLHSLMQLYGCDGITVDGAVVEGKNGISFGTAKNHIVKNTTINAEGYGLRCDGNDGVKELVVSNCEIEANDPIVVRNMTIAEASYTVKFEGTNTLTASNTEGYQVVFTKGDDGTYEMPIGAYAITGADGLKIYPAAAEAVVIAGATASESANALANAIANTDASEITLASAVEYVGEAFNVTRDVVFNMAGMELNAGSTASSRNYALELYGDIDVEINDAYFTRAGITADQGANLVFKSGIINHKPERSSRYIFCAGGDDTQITIENGTFNNDRPNNSYFWVDGNAVIYVKGGTFAGVASKNNIITTNGGQVIISGGTFNFDPTAWLAAGYKAEKSGSNWTVVAE